MSNLDKIKAKIKADNPEMTEAQLDYCAQNRINGQTYRDNQKWAKERADQRDADRHNHELRDKTYSGYNILVNAGVNSNKAADIQRDYYKSHSN